VIGQISGTAGVNVTLYDGVTILFPDNGSPSADNVVLWSVENLVGSQNGDTLDGREVDPENGTRALIGTGPFPSW